LFEKLRGKGGACRNSLLLKEINQKERVYGKKTKGNIGFS